MGRARQLRWYHFAEFRFRDLGLAIVLLLLLTVLADPVVRRDQHLQGLVAGACSLPPEFRDGTCLLPVRLSDGRLIHATATSPGTQYAQGEQVSVLQFQTWVLRRNTFELEQVSSR